MRAGHPHRARPERALGGRRIRAGICGRFWRCSGETAPAVTSDDAQRQILERFLGQAGPVTLEDIRARYAFPEDWLQAELDRLIEARELVHGHSRRSRGASCRSEALSPQLNSSTGARWSRSIAARWASCEARCSRCPLRPMPTFLARWQHLAPGERLRGEGALTRSSSSCAPRRWSGAPGSATCCRCAWRTTNRPNWTRSARGGERGLDRLRRGRPAPRPGALPLSRRGQRLPGAGAGGPGGS